MLLSLSWSLSATFLMITHPLALGAVLMGQTIIIALTCSLFNMTAWFSYILFLIMVGGMLIMFIYMTSVASNEKFKLPNNKIIAGVIMLMTLPALLSCQENFIKNTNVQDTFINPFNLISLTKYYIFPMNQTLMFLMIYLLFVLIASVKIAKIKNSSLRKK
uniref:NADH-ubiquinone oxidoreductase chain 6 n=1 Tax=Scolytus schevyrewi TaxID=1158787 RepID=A0A6G6C8U1_9CUCU|nr:NADH dehydrogenase subunit 6 [Scolytus schevyrewi]QID77582.1 NADH dehydrogenase subunit 6 [Scolytus schevyrewi]